MEKERDAKEYAWKWVTADELLSKVACDLHQVIFSGSTKGSHITIYNGENTNGELIGVFEAQASPSLPIKFDPPIYCRRGLYIDVYSYFQGCLVSWRPRASKER